MSESFNVLAANLDLSHHYLIEASAGTGKTFSIENIILRLLIENDESLQLGQILAVTFTRAAVADMKMRVKVNLLRILDVCKLRLQGKEIAEIPEFLCSHFEKGIEPVKQLKRKLEKALASFDQACIYTIHSFCARMLRENMLEGNIFIDEQVGEKDLPQGKLHQIARDFLRTELVAGFISSRQLEIVIKKFKDFEGLVKALAQSVASIVPIEPAPSFTFAYDASVNAMKNLQEHYQLEGQKILEDFIQLAPTYKEVCNRKGEIHPEILSAAKSFSEIFDKKKIELSDFNFLLEHRGFWNEVLSQKKVKDSALTLHYPGFSEKYRNSVEVYVKQASDPEAIFSILASACQKMGQNVLAKSDQLGFNSLLCAMQSACKNPSFAAAIRARFQAVVIDEFQDTDPIQWEIFRLLFPLTDHSWGRIFLVGDPKQSIYSFRQADIYTYLSASKELEGQCKAHLDCNFRSEPSLIKALNCIFDETFVPNFIQLPLLHTAIQYLPVKAGGKVADLDLEDNVGSLHFLVAEQSRYNFAGFDQEVFPFLASEIHRMYVKNGLKLAQFAVLVADRFQGDRLINYLRTWNIPAVYQRAPSLKESIAVKAMRELLTALIDPRDESALKIALGGPVIGRTHVEIRLLEDCAELEKALIIFFRWRDKLWNEGFAAFFEDFMLVPCFGEKNITQRLLGQHDAPAFYNEWTHLAELLIERHSHCQISPERLIDDLLAIEENEEESSDTNIQMAGNENAVKVLTIHSSKGLEFDFVFAIGLYKRSLKPSGFIPIPCKGGYTQKAVDVLSEAYANYCEEVDAEKMRQLYVAFTRAKHRLYVPVIFAKPEASYLASPMELFAARLGPSICNYIDLYKKIAENSSSAFEKKIEALAPNAKISITRLHKDSIEPTPITDTEAVEILSPPYFEVVGTPSFLKSYTLLAQPSGHDGSAAPADFLAENKSPHTLPAGSEAGILLHAILEKISFPDVSLMSSPTDLLPYVRTFTEGSGFRNWDAILSEIVFTALKAPLFKDVVPLAEISPRECFREMEFVFPSPPDFGFNGYLKGVIDLIFRYKGKYYLVDWKSNWLGPTADAYNLRNMEKAMSENDYFLQVRIYKEAVHRYFKLFKQDSLGGIAYVFLRGISPSSGVYNPLTTE